eukprot:21654_1
MPTMLDVQPDLQRKQPIFPIEILYLQEKSDLGRFHFTKEQAEFLRLVEYMKKFALEYEAGDTKYSLWPWYRNSFHSDDSKCGDINNYEELMYKYDFIKSWSIREVLQCIKSRKTKFENTHEKSIRFKRKFAANLLLSPQDTARHINLLRNQFDSLVNDIINNAISAKINDMPIQDNAIITEINDMQIQGKVANESMSKKSYQIIFRDNIEKAYQIIFRDNIEKNDIAKQEAIIKYCETKINADLTVVKERKEELNILIDIICNLESIDEINVYIQRYIDNQSIDFAQFVQMGKDAFANDFVQFVEECDSNIDNGLYTKQAMKLWKLIIKYVSNKVFWPNQIEKTNLHFKQKSEQNNKYGLFQENTVSLRELDVDKFKLPIFEALVEFLFINTDKQIYNIIYNPNHKLFGGESDSWYRQFLRSWRKIPIWYTYAHDILLLETVLRNGLNCNKILQDLQGDRMSQYKIRLQCNEGNTTNDPYYEFKRWIINNNNILHRLKYITNIIIKNLENEKYGGKISLMK